MGTKFKKATVTDTSRRQFIKAGAFGIGWCGYFGVSLGASGGLHIFRYQPDLQLFPTLVRHYGRRG